MDGRVGSEVASRWHAPLHVFVLIFATLVPLLALQAGGSPSATGIAATAFLVGLLIATTMAIRLAAVAASADRRPAAYRRPDRIAVESSDPPTHPVRPRAPGLV